MTTSPNLPPEFTSGNSIPVERATITRERMAEIQLAAYQAGRKVSTIESMPVLAAAMALLVAGGFVTEEKVDEAIQIALHSQGNE